MEKFDDIDDFLAKWADGSLSDSEKEVFRQTEDYRHYQAILKGTDLLEVPDYDKNRNFEAVQEKISKEPKVVRLVPKWAYAAAASIALLIGYVFFFNQTVTYETGFGEQLAVTLPDNSEVVLNAKSKLQHKKKDWQKERTLSLWGEAYFKVEKGSTFTVDTDNGKVTVLGTQFTVNSEKDVFEVICFEGKVKVEKNALSKIITKGQAVRYIDNTFEEWNLNDREPSWTQDETTFKNTPIRQVIRALEKQYNVTINSSKIDVNRRFTGSFTHDNLKTALSTVFESLEIKFTFKDEKTIDLVIE